MIPGRIGFEPEINDAFVVRSRAGGVVFLSLCLIPQMEMIKPIMERCREAKITCVGDLTFKGA